MSYKIRVIITLTVFCFCESFAYSQETESVAKETVTKVEIFSGVDFNYRDIFNSKLYEVLVNLTPGIKWKIGNGWMLAGQMIVPIYNDYGERYKRIRLNMTVLSKELNIGKQFFKVSGGLFGQERYGVDLKWMFPITDWLALDGQIGYTGYCSMAKDWECSKMDRLTGWLGTRVYINSSNTEFRLQGGRYKYTDYGVIGECMRHFRHCTVGLYAQYSSKGEENGGFKIIMMLPPYKRKKCKVRFRTASNFRFTNNIQADPYSLRLYATDPEENEREGYFTNSNLKWGNKQVDFKEEGVFK